MIRMPLRTISALIPIVSWVLWAIPAHAQNPFVQPPIRPSVDENGVELVSGQFRFARTDIAIGQPGAGGLSFGGMTGTAFMSFANPAWYTGTVTTMAGQTTAIYTVSIGGYAESFSKANSPSNSPFVSVQGLGTP